MGWRRAFREQARSDDGVRRLLNDPRVAYSHRLHYLQMVTEKLAKSFTVVDDPAATPRGSHVVLVRFLRSLKSAPQMHVALGFANRSAAFSAYIDSVVGLAEQIQRLAPSEAGFDHPNPEYPWRNRGDGRVIAPCDHAFAMFDPASTRMARFEKLLAALLRYGG